MPTDGDNRASYGIIKIVNSALEFEIRRVEYPIKETLALAASRNFPEFEEYRRILKEAKIKR